jgi:hypothetical protein
MEAVMTASPSAAPVIAMPTPVKYSTVAAVGTNTSVREME